MTPLIKSVDDILLHLPDLSWEEEKVVRKAYDFAKKAHEGQRRYSGEPYFNHVFETALILAELGMGPKTVSAGLLHDTIEDTPVTDEDVKKEFGEEILFLVTGVTKLGEIRYQGTIRHIESLRKLFIATSEDIRILIVKLADRLHNMRTLEYVPKEKQNRIAAETMEVYAPIAHRLGMGRIKGELEDLSFKYLYPDDYKTVLELSKGKYEESMAQLERIYAKLKVKLTQEKIAIKNVDYRRKHLWSLYLKLKRKDMDIDRIYDISALRIIVGSISDCYKALGVVHSLWRPLPGRIKDYIAFPKPNGYQSIHTTVFTGEGNLAEIQIRTEDMHVEAEFGIASHFQYKAGRSKNFLTSDIFRQLLPGSKSASEKYDLKGDVPQWVREMASTQQDVSAPNEFMKNLREDFFGDRIFVFTPKGDVIDLPSGSSPVDFAYQIHTSVGDRAAGSKINSKMAALSTELQNGDIVEIITNKNSKPNRKWLEFVKTAFAKKHIRSALREQRSNSN